MFRLLLFLGIVLFSFTQISAQAVDIFTQSGKARGSVVHINSDLTEINGQEWQTAYIVTCAHVFDGRCRAVASFPDGQGGPLQCIIADHNADVCIAMLYVPKDYEITAFKISETPA